MRVEKVLITGVTGLVGYATYTHLTGQPARYEVYGLDRQRAMSARTPGAWRNDSPDERFHLCDLTDFDGIRAAVAGMDVVVHLAADPKGDGWESLRRSRRAAESGSQLHHRLPESPLDGTMQSDGRASG